MTIIRTHGLASASGVGLLRTLRTVFSASNRYGPCDTRSRQSLELKQAQAEAQRQQAAALARQQQAEATTCASPDAIAAMKQFSEADSDETKRAKEILERTGAQDISSTGEARGDKSAVPDRQNA